MTRFTRDFDSLNDFLDWLRDTPRAWLNTKQSEDGNYKFRGTRTYQEAQDLARFGWPEGRQNMDTALREAARNVTLQAPPSRWLDVGGAYPLVPAAIAGDPLNMVNIGEEQRAQRPVIRFLVSLSISGGIDKESIITRGAAILSWIDALENAGFRCEVSACLGARFYNGTAETTFVLKRAQEPLDIDRMAYALVHPSMLRRHLFAFLERSPKALECSTYGSPHETTPDSDQIYFGKVSFGAGHWSTPAYAAAHIRQQIENGGISLDEDDTDQAA